MNAIDDKGAQTTREAKKPVLPCYRQASTFTIDVSGGNLHGSASSNRRPPSRHRVSDIWMRPGNNLCDIAFSGISDLPARRAQTGTASVWSQHDYLVVRSFAVRTCDAGDSGEPFAYGGGSGSIEYLAQQLGGLELAWPHCNMTKEGEEFKQVPEPFSFVSRAASTGVAEALDVPAIPARGESRPISVFS